MRPVKTKNCQNFGFLKSAKDLTKINSRKGKLAVIYMFYIFKMFPFKYVNVCILTNKKVWHDEVYPSIKNSNFK